MDLPIYLIVQLQDSISHAICVGFQLSRSYIEVSLLKMKEILKSDNRDFFLLLIESRYFFGTLDINIK